MSDPNKPDDLSPEESAAWDEADKQVEMAIKELDPVSITLNGEEAMQLVVLILKALGSGQEEAVQLVFKGTRALKREGKTNEEAVGEVLQIIKTAGAEVPRYLAPLMLHCMAKLDEIKERES